MCKGNNIIIKHSELSTGSKNAVQRSTH